MRYLLLLGLLLLGLLPSAPAAWAQKGTIEGVVLDSASGRVLREASVSLLRARDSSYVTFTITGGEGQFALRGVPPGQYQLLITFLGYESRRRAVRLTAEAPTVRLGALRLAPLTQQLGEAVVTHERAPVSVHGDTLAFSARAFRTAPNATVEALLRKLPGVEVDRTGAIRAQGQAVQRVLVDGKPFFGDDPRVATRNLPADVIDQVQLFDQQSDQAAFSGLDDGQRQRTVNLVTRRDKRRGYFGTNALGVGTAGRYQGRLGLNRFNNGRQLSLLGSANNLNQQDFSANGTVPLGAEGTPGLGTLLGGAGGSGERVVVGGPDDGADPNAQPTSITEAGALGANYRDAWGPRAEVAMSYLGNRTIETTDQQVRRQNVAPAVAGESRPPLVTDRTASERVPTTGHRFFGRLDYALDSLTALRLTPHLLAQHAGRTQQAGQQSATAGQLLNQGLTRTAATTDALAGGGSALLMRKFRRSGRALSAHYAAQLNGQDGVTLNRATNRFFAPDTTATALDQRLTQSAATRQQSLTVSYVEPLSLTRKVEVHAALTDQVACADRAAADFTAATGAYDQPNAGLSNAFRSTFTAPRVGALVQTRRLRYAWGLGLDAQPATLRVQNQSADTAFSRHYATLLPNAMFGWTGPRGRQLRVNYRTRLSPPGGAQLQPVADNANPLNVLVGNPQLRPEYVHQLTATYTHFDMGRNRSVFGFVSARQVQDRIVAATTFSPGGAQRTQPVNAGGYHALNGFCSLGQRLTSLRLNVNLTTTAAYTRDVSFVQELPNRSRSWQAGQGLRVNSTFNDRLEFGVGATLTWQQARYARLPQQNSAFWTRALTADLYYQLPGRFVLTTDLWYTATTGRAAGFNQRVALLNAGLARQLFSNRQAELKLSVFDLLNQNRGIQRTVAATYLEDVRSRVLTRYLLVSFTYHLRKFGV